MTPEQLNRAKEILARPKTVARPATLEEIYAERTLGMAEYPATLKIPVQAVRVGDVGLGGIPCETFVETGLALKAKSPFKPSAIFSIANGYFGYLPTPEHHRLGGYETWLGTNRLEERASEKIPGRAAGDAERDEVKRRNQFSVTSFQRGRACD